MVWPIRKERDSAPRTAILGWLQRQVNARRALRAKLRPLLQSPPRRGDSMATLSSLAKQLKTDRDRVERQLSGLNAALAAFAGVYRGTAKPQRKHRKRSVAARKKMAAAQRKRWAKVRAQKLEELRI